MPLQMNIWKNSRNDGPWGRPPQPPSGGGRGTGGGNGGDTPPDFDELLRKSREQFNQFFGGKGGKGGGGSAKSILLAVGAIAVLWLMSGFYVVDAKEEGVVLRFGEYHRKAPPGLHYHFPYPVETVAKVPVTVVNSVEIGMRSGGRSARDVPQESLMLTGDENIVDINFEVQWRISDAEKFLFNVRDPEATVKSVAESAMREVIGRTPIANALAEGKSVIQKETHKLMQETLEAYGAGVDIVALQLRKVDPPQAVIDAFRDVQTARADLERARNEAETYRNDILPRARGEAERIMQEAEAYKSEVVARAEGEAKRFISVYDQYKNAKDVTRKRMYLETMEEVLSGINKILIDTDGKGSGVVPFFALKDLMKDKEPRKESQ